jgi:hypothetical protein
MYAHIHSFSLMQPRRIASDSFQLNNSSKGANHLLKYSTKVVYYVNVTKFWPAISTPAARIFLMRMSLSMTMRVVRILQNRSLLRFRRLVRVEPMHLGLRFRR